VAVHEGQDPGGDAGGAGRIIGEVEQGDHPGDGRAVHDLAGGDRQPALDVGGGDRLLRQPSAVGRIAAGQIDQDGVAVGQDQVAVLQHRDLAQRVEGQEGRRGADVLGRGTKRQARPRAFSIRPTRWVWPDSGVPCRTMAVSDIGALPCCEPIFAIAPAK
jgi:hypothetical protein